MADAEPFTARPRSSGHPDYGIEAVVAELRTIRESSLEQRRRLGSPVKLPSQKSLRTIVEHLTAAFFPNRLGSRSLDDDGVD